MLKAWHMSDQKRKTGFAVMDPEKQREIARKGGKAAAEQGVGHRFSSDEGRAAGRKGGIAVQAKRRQNQAPGG